MPQSIYTLTLHGLSLRTGDLICTSDGAADLLPGEFWRVVGRLLPGDVDHIAIYVGPGGRCIEAGAKGVIAFDVPGGVWDAPGMAGLRGLLLDTFYGVAYPLQGRGLSAEQEAQARAQVRAYCYAQLGKPYNLNFFDVDTEDAFYCSQLAYKAYLPLGINLNAGRSMPGLPRSERIIYPQEIWDGLPHAGLL
ncbi:MAG: hypothetical protein JW726_19665 [Anaerolineales bacterium]|nr:hypothetical protein [Anaerolineales bacterium]